MVFEASAMSSTWKRWLRCIASRQAVLLAAVLFVHAATTSARAADRVALVIGNSRYQAAELRNPTKDAEAMADALEGLDFTVIEKRDLDRRQMNDAVVEFYRKLTDGSLALFFYAGHGMQVKGENYLVPVDAVIREEFEVSEQCVNVGKVLGALDSAPSKLKIVVLDCCRNNPYQRSWRRASTPQGLAAISELPEGTLIAFSTAPGTEAADGEGKNSPYTEQLVRVLRSRPPEGLELVEIFREASREVKKATGQTPWLNMDASLPKVSLWSSIGASPSPTVPAATSASPPTRPEPMPTEVPATSHFTENLGAFGQVPRNWVQVGELTNNQFEVERPGTFISGDFTLRLTVTAQARHGFRITLVGADKGADVAVEGGKTNAWSGTDDWSFMTPEGQARKGIIPGARVFTLQRQGKVFTFTVDQVFNPQTHDTKIATFVVAQADDFQALRIATNGAGITVHSVNLP
jgi:hypothetical protein